MKKKDYEYFINQLDLLIGFLDVSTKEVYNKIKNYDRAGNGFTIEYLYDNEYKNYSNHITNSALLLGFAHLEDFLIKCITKLLMDNSQPNKYKVEINYLTVQEKGRNLKSYMAEMYARKINFREKINIIHASIKNLDDNLIEEMRFVAKIRNCLMHNNGIADQTLVPRYNNGEKIILTSEDVHNYGWRARELAEVLYDELRNKR